MRLDFSSQDPVFLVACLGNAFGMLGLYVPFVFMADRSIMLGIPASSAAFLLSVIGEFPTGLRGSLKSFFCSPYLKYV